MSLIEALVAMAVMAFGMLAVMGVQATLRFNGDLAKQRSEATRIAERKLEELRSFKDFSAWNAVVQQNLEFKDEAFNTTYRVSTRIVAPNGSPQKVLTATVTWTDRQGNEQSLVLGDTLARAAPVLSGLSTVHTTLTAFSGSGGAGDRNPTIPTRAHDMGNGESVFKPLEGGTVAWTFNNTTGVITSVCLVSSGQTSADLNSGDVVVGVNCTATSAQLLSGFVRFNLRGDTVNLGTTSTLTPMAGGSVVFTINNSAQRIVSYCVDPACAIPLSPVIAPFDPVNDSTYSMLAIDSEDPRWPALPLTISAGVTSGNRPTPSDQCFSNAPLSAVTAIGRTAVEYFCIIYPETPAVPKKIWSGMPVVVPDAYLDDSAHRWAVGSTAGTYRVCRYTTAADNVAVTANTNHPLAYTNVSGNLINQNFLVIAGQKSCPTDGAANPAAGDFVNSNTLPHQPSS